MRKKIRVQIHLFMLKWVKFWKNVDFYLSLNINLSSTKI